MITVNHDDEISELNKATDEMWNKDHAISGDIEVADISDFPEIPASYLTSNPASGTFRVPLLVESLTPSAVSNFTFSAISGSTREYLLKMLLTGSQTLTTRLTLNASTTSGDYVTYDMFQEADGNSIHLTSWDTSRTIARIYNTSPYISEIEAKIIVIANQGCVIRTNFSMFKAGHGYTGTWFAPSGFSDLTSIKIETDNASYTVSGTAKLYLMSDLVLATE